MKKRAPAKPTSALDRRLQQLESLVIEYRILTGRVIESLGFYDSDDGHNDLVHIGLNAEAKRLEDAYDKLPKPSRKARR